MNTCISTKRRTWKKKNAKTGKKTTTTMTMTTKKMKTSRKSGTISPIGNSLWTLYCP